jgi:hypothetical protein
MNNLSNNDQPIPSDDADKPIPLPKTNDAPGVSRAPLTLGGGAGKPAPAPSAAPKAAPKATPKIVTSTPIGGKSEQVASAAGRISGVKTFFTKLHPGALEFLDEQINAWLEKNPEVSIKYTNITTGEVQSKKTEPNIIVVVWY